MKQLVLLIASVYGTLSVVFGAFGAHVLKSKIGAEKLVSFETGVRYQMYHAIVLLFVGYLFQFTTGIERSIAYLFIVGIFLFSFSIYGLSLQEILPTNIKFLGPVTPLGGLLLVLGWILLFVRFLKSGINPN